MRELQLAWHIIGVMLVLHILLGEPLVVWPGFVVLVAVSVLFAVLLEQPRRRLITDFARRRELDGSHDR